MMRERSDPAQKKCIITSLCIVAILLGFLYVYYGSLFSSQSHDASALEYGSRSLRKLGSSCLGEDEDNNKKQDESSTKYGQENGEDDVTLKNLLEVWRHRVESYWNLMSKKIKPNTLRNET